MKRLIFVVIALFLYVWLVKWVTHTELEAELLYEKFEYRWPVFKWDERINKLVRYTYDYCVERLWEGDLIKNTINYSCWNQSLTWTAENGAWWWWVVSPTADHWICQLNYTYHSEFIDSEKFNDVYEQIHYCQKLREEAYRSWRMPRMAYKHRNSRRYLFE